MIKDLRRSAWRLLNRFGSDRRGNVLILMGFSVIPLTLAGGIAIDYSNAARLQTKLNAAADAAALTAVSTPMMKENDQTAKKAAKAMFNSQVNSLPGLIYDTNDLVVTITSTNGATSTRKAVVSYTAQSQNAFGGIIGMSTIEIGGTL